MQAQRFVDSETVFPNPGREVGWGRELAGEVAGLGRGLRGGVLNVQENGRLLDIFGPHLSVIPSAAEVGPGTQVEP